MINSNGDTTWGFYSEWGSTWEKANDPCPTGWRLPTRNELQSLGYVSSQWTTLNGVNGRLFGNDNVLFLPTAGYRRRFDSGSLAYVGTSGHYWSGTSISGHVYFTYDSFFITYPNVINCYSVRCVVE